MFPWCGLFQDYLTCIIHGFLPRIPPKQRQDQQWNWQFSVYWILSFVHTWDSEIHGAGGII